MKIIAVISALFMFYMPSVNAGQNNVTVTITSEIVNSNNAVIANKSLTATAAPGQTAKVSDPACTYKIGVAIDLAGNPECISMKLTPRPFGELGRIYAVLGLEYLDTDIAINIEGQPGDTLTFALDNENGTTSNYTIMMAME